MSAAYEGRRFPLRRIRSHETVRSHALALSERSGLVAVAHSGREKVEY